MKKHNNLYTSEFEKIDLSKPLSEHPFPQFKRDSYFSLNGKWEYKITKDINDLNNFSNNIIVPFPIESTASSVNKRLQKNQYIIYRKSFDLPNNFIKKNTFINFIGVDQEYFIILNNKKYGLITPMLLPSKVDISNDIKEKNNELIVIVKDNLKYEYPLGKQSKKQKGIFYTPFSGIYYPVYIESIEDNYIESIKIDTDQDTLRLIVNSDSKNYNLIIKEKGKIIHNINYTEKDILIKIESPIKWSIDNPFLYTLEISTKTDKIYSYFGLKEIKMANDFVYLNNQKIFLNGLLSQGYYPEGIITPPSYKLLEDEILKIKDLGFNTIREHIKFEVPYFYYLCDKYGILVLQDFLNNGKYNFLSLTALPTIGLKNKSDKKMNKNKKQRNNFIDCAEKLINQLYNHPCIIGYTIFNEGWGQFDSDNIYEYFKTKYPHLLFDSTSGWFKQNISDFNSEHLYFKNIDKIKDTKKPIFLSEFGALCYKEINHVYSNKKVFAYKYFNTREALENAYLTLYNEKIIPYKDKLTGIIYTQLSDIEEEDNGIFSYDRKIIKIDEQLIKNINEILK